VIYRPSGKEGKTSYGKRPGTRLRAGGKRSGLRGGKKMIDGDLHSLRGRGHVSISKTDRIKSYPIACGQRSKSIVKRAGEGKSRMERNRENTGRSLICYKCDVPLPPSSRN